MKEEYEGIIVESEDQFKEQDSQYVYAETERLKVVKQRNLTRSILIPLDRKSWDQWILFVVEGSGKSAKEQIESNKE